MKKITTLIAFLILAAAAVNAQVIVFGQIDSARLTTNGSTPVDSGMTVQIHGTVYGPNSYPTPNGQAFWLNDGTAGIKIYSKHVYGGYPTLTDGDQVTVVGTLSDYYGSAEVDLVGTNALDTIYKTASGTPDTAVVILVTAFSTQTYGELVQVNNVNMTAATNWTITAGKHYFTAKAGGLYLYIDSFTNATMFNAPQPQGIYNVRGIGDDYSPTEFNLDPRSLADFIPVTTGINEIENKLTAMVYPNPSSTLLNVAFESESDQPVVSKMFDVTGREVLAVTNGTTTGVNTIHLNTADLSNGLYVLEVRLGEKTMVTKINIVK